MNTIVLTTDLSNASRRAFAPTLKLAHQLGMKIVLLYVVHELAALPRGAPLAPSVAPPDTESELSRAHAQLDTFALRMGNGVETEVLAGTDVVDTILSYAERIEASFIALSTHGRTGFRRLVMGSIAEGIIRHSSTPIICIPRR